MRIERLELDGFGRFRDATWVLDEGLTVLYGANEAGKTTLLNGLRALLFGFEATRDGRTWYPPLAGGRRGGRLVLLTSTGERWTVERHGERGGAGALAVRAPNGNQGGQETLDRLLHGADRDLFNNIFAFGLGELQSFSSLTAEGVRGRIYGAGAGLGGTSAIDLERRLRGELDAIFLPRGQRPLNTLLARIEALRGEIADLSRQPEQHAAAHAERAALLKRAADVREAIREHREQIVRLQGLLAARPIVGQLAGLEEELAAGDRSLDEWPAHAVAVLDRRLAELAEARAGLSSLDEQLETARDERALVAPDAAVLDAAGEILGLREERSALVATGARRRDLEAALTRQVATIGEQSERSGGLDEATLVALDDAIPTVEETRQLERHLADARSLHAAADQRRRTVAEDVESRAADAASASGQDVPLAERAAALERLDALSVRLAVLDARRDRGAAVGLVAVAAVAVAIALAAALGGVLVGEPLVGAALGAVAGAAFIGWAMTSRPVRSTEERERLEAEWRSLLERAGLPTDATDAQLRATAHAVASDRARAELFRERRAELEARRIDLERREREVADAARALAAADGAWRDWLRARSLPEQLSPEAARQVLAAAGAARRAVAERAHVQQALVEIDGAAAGFGERVGELAGRLGMPVPRDDPARAATVAGLVDRLERAREEERRARELDARIERLAERRTPAAQAAAEREAAVRAHLNALGCPDPDAVRQRDAAAAERRELTARLRERRATLAGMAGGMDRVTGLVDEARAVDPAAIEASRVACAEELERLEAEEREAMNRIGALDATIRSLEAAEELGARRQELAVLQGQADALAHEWAVRALALRLLEETRSRYERERQPDVVRAAEAHFRRITDGRYARIVAPPGDATVRVETEGGEQKLTEELSRGTAEQLYLALRFGLIEEFARHAEPLPVVLDDILVNFDAERAARAAAAIVDLAGRHQVLYFTCHRWAAELLDPDGGRTVALE